MVFFRMTLLVSVLFFLAYYNIHKYYISVTDINYASNKQTVQITSRIFMDDFESLLRQRYDENLTLDAKKDSKMTDAHIKSYLLEKIKIKINDNEVGFNYLGKEFDVDIMKVYLEIEGVKSISSFQITNKVLFDLFEDQQNMIKLNVNSKKKSFLLTFHNDHALLNFN